MNTPSLLKSLLGIALVSTTLSACNMSKHYHRMRIGHPAGTEPITATPAIPAPNRPVTGIAAAKSTDTLAPVVATQPAVSKPTVSKPQAAPEQPQNISVTAQKSRPLVVLVTDKKPGTKKQVRKLIRKSKIQLPVAGKATKDGLGGSILILALVGGIIVALVSGSAGAGVLAGIGIALLIAAGIVIGFAIVLLFLLKLINGDYS